MEFGRLLLAMADTRRIAMFVLGQYASGVMPERLSEFQNAFTDYALSAYETQLDRLKGFSTGPQWPGSEPSVLVGTSSRCRSARPVGN